jgi:predicted dehydrogenase
MRVAFVSTAHIHARPYLEGIAQARDGRVVEAIWDDVPARGQRHAALCGARFEPDLDALLRTSAIDAFVVCAENTRHLPLLERTLAAGKPVLCEKPLVTTVSEAKALAQRLRGTHAPLLTGYFLPQSADMRAVAAMLAREEFGNVTRVRIRNSHHGAYGRWFDPPDLRWFTEPTLSGGGAFMDVGSHAVHLATTLFGPVTEVWAELRNVSGIYPACDDGGVAHLRFASGALGTIEASWTETGGENGLEVTGSRTALWKVGSNYVTGAHGTTEPRPLVGTTSRPTQIDRLAAAVRGELTAGEISADVKASLRAVAVMSAAYQSARSGNWERVPV